MNLHQIGLEIQFAQVRAGLDNVQLGKLAGVAPNTVSAARIGKGVSSRNLVKILQVLGLELAVRLTPEKDLSLRVPLSTRMIEDAE